MAPFFPYAAYFSYPCGEKQKRKAEDNPIVSLKEKLLFDFVKDNRFL